MKRLGLCLLLLPGLCGCFTTDPLKPVTPVQRPRTETARPPITAEQLTPDNAHKMSQILLEEMDRDTNQNLTDTPSVRK